MPKWFVSVPVWGHAYVKTFVELAAPALCHAVRVLAEPVTFVIHTDSPDAISGALAGCGQSILFRPLPAQPTYVALQQSHADAVQMAAPGDRVVLLNADLVVSANLLQACARHFASGKQAVVLVGIRTARCADKPPIGAEPRALLAWAWDHRHQIIRDLEWSTGRSMLPTNLFWEVGASVVMRGFHLHPVAVVKQPSTTFHSTIDGDLLDCFPREAIHVVTSPDDCAMLEVSPPERRFPVRAERLAPALVAGSMRTRASAMHRWLFTHRIIVRGTGAEVRDDEAAAAEILRLLGDNSSFGRPQRGVEPTGRRGEPTGAR